MKVLILGSSGIIAQHMGEKVPNSVELTFVSRSTGVDLSDLDRLEGFIRQHEPEVVVNLAGESNTDTVEAHPESFWGINAGLPYALARLTDTLGYRFIQVSSQAVFSGQEPPYYLNSPLDPVNAYGRQKAAAETAVLNYTAVTVIRPTFVLGVRPDLNRGRVNPMEQMLAGNQRKQVDDRFFSISFAPDVASLLWSAVIKKPDRKVIQVGIPGKLSRYEIACHLGLKVEPVSHESFPGLAPRPRNTSYAVGEYLMGYAEGLQDCRRRWKVTRSVVLV